MITPKRLRHLASVIERLNIAEDEIIAASANQFDTRLHVSADVLRRTNPVDAIDADFGGCHWNWVRDDIVFICIDRKWSPSGEAQP